MPRKVYSTNATNESGFTEIFFFSQMATRWRTPSVVLQTLQQSLQNSQLRKNIAFVNIFKFNSTCPVVNWVIHLWIGKLLNDNWINVNSVKSSRFPLIYHLGIWPRSTYNAKGGGEGDGWQTTGGRKFNKILSAREAGRSLAP